MLRMLEFRPSNIFWGSTPPRQTLPIHAWYVGHTRGLLPLLSPSNILSHRKVHFQKMHPPPHGKILKKDPEYMILRNWNDSRIFDNVAVSDIGRRSEKISVTGVVFVICFSLSLTFDSFFSYSIIRII